MCSTTLFTRTSIFPAVIFLNRKLLFESPFLQIFLENPENKNWDESEFPTVHNGYTISDCATAVCHLHKLASIMRKRRFDNGALAINQPKLAIEIDKATCEPLSYSLYILHESNWLVESTFLYAFLNSFMNLVKFTIYQYISGKVSNCLQHILGRYLLWIIK